MRFGVFSVFFKSARLRVLEIMKLNMQVVIKLLQTLPQTLSMSRASDPVPDPVLAKWSFQTQGKELLGNSNFPVQSLWTSLLIVLRLPVAQGPSC